MLKINGVNLETMTEPVKPNDIRMYTDWTRGDKRFLTPINLFTGDAISTDFKQNGAQWKVAAKGHRPVIEINPNPPVYTQADVPPAVTNAGLDLAWYQKYNKYIDKYKYRVKETTPGTYYLIKFSDKSVRWCSQQVPYTNTPPVDSLTVATAEEDAKIILTEFVGGGGGGAPGGLTLCGTGGGSGAYVFAALKIEHPAMLGLPENTFPFIVGKGGNGGVYRKGGATPGDPTGINGTSVKVIAHGGGNGSNDNQDPGVGGTVEKTANLQDLIVILAETNGIKGNANDPTIAIKNASFAAPNEAMVLDRPVQPGSPNSSSGGGGGTPFGFGAEGRQGRNDGWTGPHPGTGASGGGWYHNGGLGGFGCALLYY